MTIAPERPLLRFHRATLGWDNTPVLTDVDWELERGSFWGILGYNGSGKTTLLKTLLGLIPCLSGRYEWSGSRLGAPSLGYVPQKERLDPIYPLTGYEVAAMGTYKRVELFERLRGIDRRPAVEKSLAECGAAECGARRFGDLSGGQKQRVLIARALAAEPEVLVLDEPMAGIDIETQRSLLALLKHIKEEKRLSVLMVSHRVQAERGLFTHIAWAGEGKLEAGPAEKMLAGGKVSQVFGAEP